MMDKSNSAKGLAKELMMGLKRLKFVCSPILGFRQFQSYNLSQNHTIKEPRMKRQVGLLRECYVVDHRCCDDAKC